VWLVASQVSGEQHGWFVSHAVFSTLLHWLTQMQLAELHAWPICALFTQLFVESQHAVVAEQLPPRLAHVGAWHVFVVVSQVYPVQQLIPGWLQAPPAPEQANWHVPPLQLRPVQQGAVALHEVPAPLHGGGAGGVSQMPCFEPGAMTHDRFWPEQQSALVVQLEPFAWQFGAQVPLLQKLPVQQLLFEVQAAPSGAHAHVPFTHAAAPAQHDAPPVPGHAPPVATQAVPSVQTYCPSMLWQVVPEQQLVSPVPVHGVPFGLQPAQRSTPSAPGEHGVPLQH
jgi:hypothetical protein